MMLNVNDSILGINNDYQIDNDNGLKVASVHKPHSRYPFVSPMYNFFKNMSHLILMSNSKNVSNFCLFIWQLQPHVQFKNMSNLNSKFQLPYFYDHEHQTPLPNLQTNIMFSKIGIDQDRIILAKHKMYYFYVFPNVIPIKTP